MTLWIDAQLPPPIAHWLTNDFGLEAFAVRDLGLRDSSDREIFLAAKIAGAVVMTKDADFVELLYRLGPPPKILWVTYGNTSKAALRPILEKNLERAVSRLNSGEILLEIG